ncbi:hypothetical protein ACJZTR_01800 [Neorickettsia risticii]|uniref:Uncharacterized protein n=1 Tax=Neorickettsia risticii (strain Illinois) TaxID=434131 RepID=C6V4T0_NEORI|nr:hypothetical protein [Neorickettsia risticii]ACT69390.1 conserved hypothetical protein [Neorickettsia risticii str. Illinois]
MKKFGTALCQFDRDLILQYGGARFLIYYHWGEIIGEDKRFDGVTVRRVSYSGTGNIIVHVCARNSGNAVKLRHCIDELEERIKLCARIGCGIKVVLSL